MPPMLILTVTLVIIPILLSGVISFSNWNFVSGLDGFGFVGLDNYTRLVQDESFHRSLYNNLIMIAVVPVAMFLALVLAVLINKATYFKTFFSK
ncbi:carbohydrate ABC transporter permease [Paenibacillus rhizoplanae]